MCQVTFNPTFIDRNSSKEFRVHGFELNCGGFQFKDVSVISSLGNSAFFVNFAIFKQINIGVCEQQGEGRCAWLFS